MHHLHKVALQLVKSNGESQTFFVATKDNGDYQLLLQVDSLLTPDQRIHAVRELDEWIEIIDSIIMEN